MMSAECDAIHRAATSLAVENPDLALNLMRAARQYEIWEGQIGTHAQSADLIEFKQKDAP